MSGDDRPWWQSLPCSFISHGGFNVVDVLQALQGVLEQVHQAVQHGCSIESKGGALATLPLPRLPCQAGRTRCIPHNSFSSNTFIFKSLGLDWESSFLMGHASVARLPVCQINQQTFVQRLMQLLWCLQGTAQAWRNANHARFNTTSPASKSASGSVAPEQT